MPADSSNHYWIFREGRSSVSGNTVRSGLVASLKALRRPTQDAIVDALLRAGELETALSDRNSDDARAVAAITNALAAALVELWAGDAGLESLALIAEQLDLPESLQNSTAEGFAYYGLHPLAFADLVAALELKAPQVAVIGIRSIGATLSAVVAAAFTRRKQSAERITVRPTGHPYDRKTHFTAAQLRWIAAQRSSEAEFVVVDEGPGLSGSSFLSVGDALLETGVERRRIRFLCSHQPNADVLAAPRGAERWRAFQSHSVGAATHLPPGAAQYCGAGAWRRWQYLDETQWPATWTSMERLKYLSADKTRFFKFAGYGRYGATFAEHARTLALSGFGADFFGVSDGFAEYAVIQGSPACREDLSQTVIERIADYCAMRTAEFTASIGGESSLTAMVRFNYEQIVGEPAPDWLVLEDTNHPVLCDARMQPHEWIIDATVRARKTDGESHGNDHFFPGPCDIAWDIAGAIVEWDMNDDAAEVLLRRFALLSGNDVRGRIRSYTVAYATFRAAYCRMAAHALRGSVEQERLERAALYYQKVINSSFVPTSSDSRPNTRSVAVPT